LVVMSSSSTAVAAPEQLPAPHESSSALDLGNADHPLEAPDPEPSTGQQADDEPLEAPDVVPLSGEIVQLIGALRRVFERGLGDALAREITTLADDEQPTEAASEPPPSDEFDALWRRMFG